MNRQSVIIYTAVIPVLFLKKYALLKAAVLIRYDVC